MGCSRTHTAFDMKSGCYVDTGWTAKCKIQLPPVLGAGKDGLLQLRAQSGHEGRRVSWRLTEKTQLTGREASGCSG